MNTQIASKIAALAIALLMNSLVLGGVAYLFNANQPSGVIASAETCVQAGYQV
jgi:hypothetical protein